MAPAQRWCISPARIARSKARAAAAGGSIHTAKMAIGEYGFICLVHDTEGNLVGVHSMQ